MLNYEQYFRPLEDVIHSIRTALKQRKGLSIVRLGDGEAFSMGYEMIPNYQNIMYGYDYAGVPKADPNVRNLLLKSIQVADIVGLSDDRSSPLCAPLLEKILQHHQIVLPYICHARINWDLHGNGQGPLYQLLKGKRVMIVGRLASKSAPHFVKRGITVVDTCSLEGIGQLHQVYRVVSSKANRFDVLIAAAGIPAVPLCARVGRDLNKVAIDFGHSINDLLRPGFNVSHLPETTIRWRQQRGRRGF